MPPQTHTPLLCHMPPLSLRPLLPPHPHLHPQQPPHAPRTPTMHAGGQWQWQHGAARQKERAVGDDVVRSSGMGCLRDGRDKEEAGWENDRAKWEWEWEHRNNEESTVEDSGWWQRSWHVALAADVDMHGEADAGVDGELMGAAAGCVEAEADTVLFGAAAGPREVRQGTRTRI
ncbi:hypothetical protein B0H10DRAFT_1952335 [Mycena sp. CBHHK59/15]|nr:hypothetical protein B0H10DRAFT_1952335 [Mycena sp. CBHHK59/15]